MRSEPRMQDWLYTSEVNLFCTLLKQAHTLHWQETHRMTDLKRHSVTLSFRVSKEARHSEMHINFSHSSFTVNSLLKPFQISWCHFQWLSWFFHIILKKKPKPNKQQQQGQLGRMFQQYMSPGKDQSYSQHCHWAAAHTWSWSVHFGIYLLVCLIHSGWDLLTPWTASCCGCMQSPERGKKTAWYTLHLRVFSFCLYEIQ